MDYYLMIQEDLLPYTFCLDLGFKSRLNHFLKSVSNL
jgi:hypothetical protein